MDNTLLPSCHIVCDNYPMINGLFNLPTKLVFKDGFCVDGTLANDQRFHTVIINDY
jgi:hypothetical protein